MAIRSLGVAVLAALVSLPALADSQRSRLPLLVRPCAVCHGEAGVSKDPYIPNIAGQNVEYLIAQIEAMARSTRRRLGVDDNGSDAIGSAETVSPRWKGHRDNPIMDRQLLTLNETTIRYVAIYFASKPRACPPPAPPRRAPPLAAHCATCHGANGRAGAPGIPHLAGQKQQYLAEQLRLYRLDIRRVQFSANPTERANPIMGPQSTLISTAQAAELADWYASMPCAAPDRPPPGSDCASGKC